MRLSKFTMRRLLDVLAWFAGATLVALVAAPVNAALNPELVAAFAADDSDAKVAAIAKLGALATPDALAVLDALKNERLQATPEGHVLIVDDAGKAIDAATGKTLAALPEGTDAVTLNNRLRSALDAALAGTRLLSQDLATRRAAANEVLQNASPEQLPLLEKALAAESDTGIRDVLMRAIATARLKSPDPAARLAAVESLSAASENATRAALAAMLENGPDSKPNEADANVRSAISIALRSIDGRLARSEWVGNVFYGVSLASVLLLAALGLAITFGLMGIINMAHGELLMIGAYCTYVIQTLFRRYAPDMIDWYVVAAIPVAFAVAALVGMILERSVIRWLYGRPLETLLATWGISLMLMQSVRSIFGSQNVEVANPSWMSGGVTVLGGLVLEYNRIVIIGFALFVVFLVWVLLNKTRLGLFVRAVTQNRRMADCVGVPTGRIDMLTFGLGSGIAGLGGVALSQLGNVGPDLGQSYIVDSFMVVVLGGVGQLAGTIIAALGLGELNKLLEPYAGAVLGKIAILVIIVLFIQKRPQGLFALKGRSAD